MPLKLMYITNRVDVALVAEKYGVDRIWVDLETLGKEERQKNMNTVKSNHCIDDIKRIKPVLSTSEMLVRVNPWNENSVEEINDVIDAGADMIMLPMWKSVNDVQNFLNVVNNRCKTTLLLETKEAVWFLWEIEMARKKRNQFDVDEIYRGLRTNIEFSQMDDAIQVINVVSTIPNEGKSTVACNLARIMAAKYKNVLLIDCDLRNASVHKTLGISNRSGLTNIISEFREGVNIHSFEGVQDVQYDGGYPLSVITAGHRVPNPSEVLGSKRLAKFLNQARQEFGYIIIDCPPVAVASDAIPLCNVSDGVLYVVDSKISDKRKVKAAINDVERNGGHVMGVVLNKVESASDSNYGYGYGYGYGGEDNGKKKKKK